MRVGLLSDLHIGAPLSKWQDAAKLINRLTPDLDAFILLGDVTEEVNPYRQTLNLAKNDATRLKKRIQSALEQFLDRVSGNIHRLVFIRGNHDDQLLNRCQIVEPYAILRSKFGRIVALHGHLTNLTRYGLKFGWGVQAGRQLKSNLEEERHCGINLEPTDFLLIGHCHVAYADHQTQVYSPGCWIGDYRNRNTGWYILIDDESVDSPQTFIQLKRQVPRSYHQRNCSCGYNKLTPDALYCPACGTDLMPKCERVSCQRPLRGEELHICKRHRSSHRYYE
ncbi:MAG: metallophosphoesterase [Candidatus Helarchaeota archaeon]|nr:metallophosphoesterase family protein [Deltaproteobacteria bacterium]